MPGVRCLRTKGGRLSSHPPPNFAIEVAKFAMLGELDGRTWWPSVMEREHNTTRSSAWHMTTYLGLCSHGRTQPTVGTSVFDIRSIQRFGPGYLVLGNHVTINLHVRCHAVTIFLAGSRGFAL